MTSFQPKGYFSLFFVFLLERMCLYGVRALLVLFMAKNLLFSAEKSGTYYAWYVGVLSLSPILGGFIADMWLGQRKALVASISITVCGCLLLAVSALTNSTTLFYVATIFVARRDMCVSLATSDQIHPRPHGAEGHPKQVPVQTEQVASIAWHTGYYWLQALINKRHITIHLIANNDPNQS